MSDRKGKEWWDKFNKIQRYSFFLGNGNLPSIKATPWNTGRWIDQYEASTLVDEMQDEINLLKEENKLMKEFLKTQGWELKR